MKFLILLIAIASTAFFINFKFSNAVRVLAFKEDENAKDAKISFITMIILIMAWTIFFSCF